MHQVEYLGGDRLLYGHVSGNLPETPVIARIPSSVAYSPVVGSEAPFAVATSDHGGCPDPQAVGAANHRFVQ